MKLKCQFMLIIVWYQEIYHNQDLKLNKEIDKKCKKLKILDLKHIIKHKHKESEKNNKNSTPPVQKLSKEKPENTNLNFKI